MRNDEKRRVRNEVRSIFESVACDLGWDGDEKLATFLERIAQQYDRSAGKEDCKTS